MSLALNARIAALEERIKSLEEMGGAVSAPQESPLEARLRDLENKYRMLNARLSRKE